MYCNNEKKIYIIFFTLLFTLLLSGCFSIKLVSDYDETADKQINELYKKISAYTQELNNNPEAAGEEAVERETKFNDILLDIKSIKMRADAKEKNELQIKQADLLLDSWTKFGQLLKTKPTVEMINNAQSGIEITITAILKLEYAKRR